MKEFQLWDLEVIVWIFFANSIAIVQNDLFVMMEHSESCGDFL